MKVLFLDIDGVLNSTDNMIVQGILWNINKENKSRDQFGHLFDERCVRWLQYIIEKTGCKIVISSTWRCSGLKTMQLMWEMRDLPGEVIGCTPTEVSQNMINLYAATNNEADRGYEIQEWIDANKPEKYCIVDDDNDMLSHQKFVRTKSEYGLDKTAALSIVAVLNAV
jgi:hypothetical protein